MLLLLFGTGKVDISRIMENQRRIYALGLKLQGGPSGRGMQFVDIQLNVPPQYHLFILKRNSNFNVNKGLSSTRWTTL